VLADDLAARPEDLHADVVEVRRAMDRRARVRLRDDEQPLLAGAAPHLGRQLGERGGAGLGVPAQQAEAGARLGDQRVLALLGDEVVPAVADEREVAVGHPLEERAALGEFVGGERWRVRREVVDDSPQHREHRYPVARRGPQVGEGVEQRGTGGGERLGVGLAVDLDVHERLGDDGAR
jgi:hypothetical protein